MKTQTLPEPLSIRPAMPADLDALEELEFDCFDSDRFSRRRWRHLLTRAHAITLVLEDSNADEEEALCGYAMALLRRGSRKATLHSFCIHPRCQARGLGSMLLGAIEQAVAKRGVQEMTLGVHADNNRAQRLYRRAGYERFGYAEEAYEDGGAAWYMERTLTPSVT